MFLSRSCVWSCLVFLVCCFWILMVLVIFLFSWFWSLGMSFLSWLFGRFRSIRRIFIYCLMRFLNFWCLLSCVVRLGYVFCLLCWIMICWGLMIWKVRFFCYCVRCLGWVVLRSLVRCFRFVCFLYILYLMGI